MAPQPRRQNPQHQALTVTLKNICRDYPAGGGILRELLQNADDAGASEMVFVLDTRSHPTSNLLHSGLDEYQGPALLAYNNAKFSAKDFESLSSLGASRKEQDAFATGKFGRGFSSVFNWTDCPSIVSDTTLFFLDPHHSWSASWDPPGGPEWDFTAHMQDEAMRNQLSAYSRFLLDFNRPLDGTIVRIPLRTVAQAEKSSICDQRTTISDVRSSMEGFATEVHQGGLLFLKSVTKVSLSVNDEHVAITEITNKSEVSEARARIREALRKLLDPETRTSEHVAFDIHFEHQGDFDTSTSFSIHHYIEPSLPDRSLIGWAATNKLYPWVGIAAPITKTTEVELYGDLFTVLRLHIPTKQPVHIHGVFSISPDRGRLHGPSDASIQDQRPEKWNMILLEHLVPQAWAKLLQRLVEKHPSLSVFHLWPQEPPERREMWDSLCSLLVSQASQDDCRIWYTDFGYVSLRDGLLGSEHDFLKQRQAFHDAGIPAIYLNDTILKHASNNPKGRKLCHRTVLKFLRSSSHLHTVPEKSKIILLEYLSSELPFNEIAELAIFPFEDQGWRAINQQGVFLHRNASEKELFKGTPELNLDIDKLSSDLVKKLRDLAAKSLTSSLRLRRHEDLRDYCYSTVFKPRKFRKSLDMIDAGWEIRSFLDLVWKWIMSLRFTQRTLTAIGSLWLLPLTNGKYRKILPEPASPSLMVTYTSVKNREDIMLKIASLGPDLAPLVLDSRAFSNQFLSSLLQAKSKKSDLAVRDADVFTNFLEWLVEARHLLDQANSADKARILDAVVDWFWSTKSHNKLVKQLLPQLCVFKQVRWGGFSGTTSIDQSWTDLMDDEVFGLKDVTVVPPPTGITFIDTTDDRECGMIEGLKLMNCLNTVQMIETIVIPTLNRGDYGHCPRDLFEMLLGNFNRCSAESQASIAMLPVVPLDMRGLLQPQKYGPASSLIDPAAAALTGIFFDDEIFHPEPRFYQTFTEPLKKCRLRTTLDRVMVLDRLDTYMSNRYSLEEVFPKVKALLQLPIGKELGKDADFLQRVGKECWLPVQSHDGTFQFVHPTDCRDLKDFHVVGHVMATLPFRVEPVWRICLGWQETIAADRLVSQLDFGIGKLDLQIVDSVLRYMAKSPQRPKYLQLIKEMRVVWSNEKSFTRPDIAYQTGCQNLTPYLHNVEPVFWSRHKDLLAYLGVRSSLTSPQILEVQKQLESISPLSQAALKVALEVTRLVGLDATSSFTSLKIPTDKSDLVSVRDIVYNDLGPSDLPNNIFLTHPDVSSDTANRLKIEPLSERVRKGDLGILDLDEEEFHQQEEVIDGIRDTLERYPKEYTFHEYLANADDCGSASEVNWLLDETTYPERSLITPELARYQGPSLLVHNDGVFREKDFDGLKHVGRGSKRADATVIGKFGRGSQTMYHWTDVPMILSGGFLLILDPQQLHLPMNYRTNCRNAGVKIKLSKLRQNFQDQLAPFDRLWGYARDLDWYNGTIFRFPLRKEGSQSELLEISAHPFSTAKSTFQDAIETARLSLLFLRKIRKIDLYTRNKSPQWKLEWEVRTKKVEGDAFSHELLIQVTKLSHNAAVLSWTDTWWRKTEDSQDAPAFLQYHHKRTMKQIEYGIAALISSKTLEGDELSTNKPAPHFFNCLPLRFQSNLPVNIHATFLLSGDRQSISVEKTARDAGADWNKWLLDTAIPKLYLSFLEDIGRVIGAKVFSFFPTQGSTGEILSDLVRSSFWSLLPTSRHRLYPVVENVSAIEPIETKKEVRRQCRAPQLVEFKEALFDLLDTSTSRDLIAVLPFWFGNIVQPTEFLRDGMKGLPGVRFINPSLVRVALRSREAVGHLTNLIKQESRLLKSLLHYVTPVTDADFNELNGCGILPLVDGTLGTLVARSQSSQSNYFYTSQADWKLFSFATSILVLDVIHTRFTNKIKNSNRFNVYNLDKGHVRKLLEMKTDWPSMPDHEFKEWLLQFWKYMNERCPAAIVASGPSNGNNTYPHSQLQQLTLHEARCGTISHYTSFDSFPSLPAVVEPASSDEMKLCCNLPGLYLINSETVPTSLLKVEQPLSRLASFERLLKAMSRLAKDQGKALRDYIRDSLNRECIEILQQTVVSVFKDQCLSSRVSSTTLNDILPLARDLPIWKSKSNDYVTASDALVAADDSLVVPWSEKLDRFVDPGNNLMVLKGLGVSPLDDEKMLKHYILKNLPDKIGSEKQAPYLKFITAMSARSLTTRTSLAPLLRECKLAATRNGIMVKPSEVYDHNDKIFLAAFRYQAMDHFLSKSVQDFCSFWQAAGLHCRKSDKLWGRDYLACLYVISKRLENQRDTYLKEDVETILHPLCRDDYALRDLRSTDWSELAAIKVFPLFSDFEDQPRFRRERMESLAGSSKALSLGELRSTNDLSVCWSQVPFASFEPSSWVLDQVRSSGHPSCAIVWQHLEYLARIAETIDDSEISLFLLDLGSSYEYLHARLQDSKEAFCFPKSAVWLNVDSIQHVSSYELQHSWLRLDHLILLSACDAPPLMAIRSFLTKFENLLKAIGCKSMVYPTYRFTDKDHTEVMASRMNRLRLSDILIDVTFSTKGIFLSAHRVVLAARSEYCMSQFNGSWITGDVIELEDMTPHTLENLIDYAYQDSFDWTALQANADDDTDAIADKLDLLLDMLVGADRWLMQDMKTDIEQQILQGNRFLIRADNVCDIRNVADEVGAKELEKYCEEFEMSNAEAVRLANLSDGGELIE